MKHGAGEESKPFVVVRAVLVGTLHGWESLAMAGAALVGPWGEVRNVEFGVGSRWDSAC